MSFQRSLYLQNSNSLRVEINVFSKRFHIYTFVFKNTYFYY